MIVIPKAARLTLVNNLIATGKQLDGLLIHLFANDYTPDVNSLVGDFVEATFTGYSASSAVVWGTPYLDITESAVVVGDVKQFLMTATTTTNIIYGYWAQNAGGLQFSERFDTPVPMSEVDAAVILIPRYSFGQ